MNVPAQAARQELQKQLLVFCVQRLSGRSTSEGAAIKVQTNRWRRRMRSLAYLSLALAASLTTALPASAQDETSGTEQTTGAADQTTEEAGAQDAGQTETEPSSDATAAQNTDQAGPSGEIHPLTITCQDVVDTDVRLVPQLVYWIDGYNIAYDAATGQADVDPIVTVAQNWLTVPVENIIRACEANPASTAADVIAQERATNEGAASQ